VLLKIDIAKAFDSVLFVAPLQQDLVVLKLALEVFGLASGLFANLDKSVATPLHCAEEDITRIQQILACRVEGFPSRYLGSLYLSSDLNGAMSNRFGRGTYSTSLAERLWQEAHYLQSRSIQHLGKPTKDSDGASAGGNVCSNSGPTRLSSMVTSPPVSRNGNEKSYPVQ